MTVLRQLLLSVTVVILVILAGTLLFSINGARTYLNSQLQADSDNAATSLALSLSQPGNQDPALREVLITALFDSGHFQAIDLRDTQNLPLVSRRMQNLGESAAPAWFSRLWPLRAPSATREVSDGWTQVGTLTVIADDTAAKSALWASSIRIFTWVVLAGALWLVFVQLLMRWLRRVLREEIARQVDSIADGQATAPTKAHKRVAELLPSSQIITQARERVQASRQEANDRIESLTVELNHDPVSNLPNRRYFMNELRRALQPAADATAAQAPACGYVFLARQRDLAIMAQTMPRDQVDAWLRDVGERLTQTAGAQAATLQLARLNGSDFVVLIAGQQGPQAMGTAQALRAGLLEARITLPSGKPCRWAIALTDFVAGDALPDVFSRLDTALMAAESAGDDDIEVLLRDQPGRQQLVVGEAAWRALLTQGLDENRLGLSAELANYGPRRPAIDRYEATLILSDPDRNQGKPLSGYLFMPAAVRLGMSADFDERALQLSLDWLAANPSELVVRISAPSLVRPGFIDTVVAVLTDAPNIDRLIVELDAYSLSTYPAETTALCGLLNNIGVRVGLRGVARQLDVLAQLQGLPLLYIKLGGGFMDHLESSQGAVSLLNAAVHTAMALRIKVLVDDTPGETGAQLLHDHGARLKRDDAPKAD